MLCVDDWRPQPLSSTEVLGTRRAAELAATLDLDMTFQAGDELPVMWHWVYFTEWPATAELGTDGHPRNGHFLPPIPDRRRMFAGGRLTVHAPLVLGREATRRAEVLSTAVKHGKTGELLFVTVRHEFSQDGRLAMTEEHDLVYRSDSGSSTPFTTVSEPLADRSTPWAHEPATHPALLFRFSALTANAHRIHYDAEYTSRVEGFPALVVHGPLLALYMSELARTNSPRPLRDFSFRLARPVFVGDAIRAQGTPAADGATAELAVVSGAGTVHASARAEFA
ncbi:MaoC family dehydratase N-terminal domain-containing protein [Mycobacterium sp. GA-2829]|uniref:FAS1-like dehydratase domain-containing protein n=1 Tax=Mycobacterium sp. GA-2829 TaxID=1772283 RepID=UPI00074039EB|nr:MaoC family dehydratase N-terminal domain-containing protein [Mycobacterium sp. GA-2829]KUI23705.1 dehydratase [Mycobacterium sp. GA-2829]